MYNTWFNKMFRFTESIVTLLQTAAPRYFNTFPFEF
jgi:hypothetical protein